MRVGSRCSMPANLDWIKLYRAVLKESDLQKRLAEIEEAERVMKQALRSAVEEGDSDQRCSISDALHQLKKAKFRIIWIRQLTPKEAQAGVEALEPQDNFWGISLSDRGQEDKKDVQAFLMLLSNS